ncbi:MAG: hypothetical protein D6698_11835 [Gammaproteobacteria bacterium]|nr:MAG: hypothetical protein D6698_11835 [Gammaproteobacteria bacterium]
MTLYRYFSLCLLLAWALSLFSGVSLAGQIPAGTIQIHNPNAEKTAEKSAHISNEPSGTATTRSGTLVIINKPTVEVGSSAPKPLPKMPKRGMSMAEVEKAFGKPERKVGPVGKPPITRWFYPEFKVVFESHYVIQAVANR